MEKALRRLKPPPLLTYSAWAEENFVLADRGSAMPGKFRLWPYQAGFLDAIGDPTISKITLIKSARIGFTKTLMASIAARVANDPCAIILLVPTDDDARRFAVDEVEPSFEASPALDGLLFKHRNDGRNTLVTKSFAGGATLKILSARSPRKLRSHDAKILFVDEADGMEITAEGDPIQLAEMRTFAHADRKIVVGSTPTDEGISFVESRYEESDRRVFEVPCPSCGNFHEIMWSDIRWPEGQPEKAAFLCPACEEMIDHRYKLEMVEQGRWRATAPSKGHAGFRINALVSPLANAAWPLLAEEYLRAKKGGPASLKPFVNTIEGRVWKTSIGSIDEGTLRSYARDVSLKKIPEDVFAVTVGVDTQDDRLEVTIVGWARHHCYVLEHVVVWGSTMEETTWLELDALLQTTWRHPWGGTLRIDATAIDSGGSEGRTQQVYDFCERRLHRKIIAIKGAAGPRPVLKAATKVKGGARLFIVGVDQVKTTVMEALSMNPATVTGEVANGAIVTSNSLPAEWYEQVTGERRVVKYVKNRAVIEFLPVKQGQAVEALDCLVYAYAARNHVSINFDRREEEMKTGQKRASSWGDWSKRLNGN